jgi:pimeloyl-ACP methyl ester carboxylesterase
LYRNTLTLGLLLIAILALSCLSTSIFKQQDGALAQQYVQTIKYRNLVIDLGNGVKTKAQLTLPAIGKGPFPGVLLIHGTGKVDMNESGGNYIRIDNKTGSKIYPRAQPFFQISQYLSERGFAVLRYDKRGVGANHTILDRNVWGNLTFNNLKQDADKALAVLAQQPEVNPNIITILGHSEGTIIAPRVAIDNPTKVKSIVLMGAAAQNLRELAYFQSVYLPLLYAEKVLDHNHDGLLSVSEATKNPVFSGMVGNVTVPLETANGTKHQLNPKYNTNKDAYISINNELKPKLIEELKSAPVVRPGEKCNPLAPLPCPIWIKSHYALEPTLNIIGNVHPATTSILILQGENDSQTPLQQAFLLQQRLTELRHPDHTLITYPNLGHVFYPSSQWSTGIGPIQQYVLADLYAWLEAHSGLSHSFATSAASTIGTNTSSFSKR